MGARHGADTAQCRYGGGPGRCHFAGCTGHAGTSFFRRRRFFKRLGLGITAALHSGEHPQLFAEGDRPLAIRYGLREVQQRDISLGLCVSAANPAQHLLKGVTSK